MKFKYKLTYKVYKTESHDSYAWTNEIFGDKRELLEMISDLYFYDYRDIIKISNPEKQLFSGSINEFYNSIQKEKRKVTRTTRAPHIFRVAIVY